MSALKNPHRRPVVERNLPGRLSRAGASGTEDLGGHVVIIRDQPVSVKALTIKQPWAWAIAAGIKRVENRSWRTNYRGWLAIHAAVRRGYATAGRRMLEELGHAVPKRDELIYSAIVAVARVADCVPASDLSDDPLAFGPWCWVLDDLQRLETPFACPGRLSLWTPPEEFAV